MTKREKIIEILTKARWESPEPWESEIIADRILKALDQPEPPNKPCPTGHKNLKKIEVEFNSEVTETRYYCPDCQTEFLTKPDKPTGAEIQEIERIENVEIEAKQYRHIHRHNEERRKINEITRTLNKLTKKL